MADHQPISTDTVKLVGTISGAVIALVAVIGVTAATVEYVSAQVHEVQSVKSNVDALTRDVAALKEGQDRLTAAMLTITGDVAALKGLKGDVDALKSSVDRNAETLGALRQFLVSPEYLGLLRSAATTPDNESGE